MIIWFPSSFHDSFCSLTLYCTLAVWQCISRSVAMRLQVLQNQRRRVHGWEPTTSCHPNLSSGSPMSSVGC